MWLTTSILVNAETSYIPIFCLHIVPVCRLNDNQNESPNLDLDHSSGSLKRTFHIDAEPYDFIVVYGVININGHQSYGSQLYITIPL
jgi:hypothetical protein